MEPSVGPRFKIFSAIKSERLFLVMSPKIFWTRNMYQTNVKQKMGHNYIIVAFGRRLPLGSLTSPQALILNREEEFFLDRIGTL
ncbi:hypothetical protein B1J93_17580 [Leptospira kirschneri serovar Pomona]|uniref:Uncharacterized protein n=1 Tax=Leptospira kirschneri serovar Pomona TaxID=561005 RepID=A0A1T1DH31_9LEPT|nr:hypothetical protein AYB32_17860 [Leptospira kirschneri]KXZ26908.1 hypothetical protein AYB34_18165 [Leptospira sp. ZV016]OOV40164.1 hypothetical protein B1J93_17580 [Leptospira kirschneri serovar Pomona]